MPILINDCADYQIEVERNSKLFSQREPTSKKSDDSTDDILDEASTRVDSIFLTENDLKFVDTLNVKRETKTPNNLKTEKANKSIDRAKLEKEAQRLEVTNTEVSKIEEKFKPVDVPKVEEVIKQDMKKLQKQVDEKEAKFNVDANKKVNKVAPLCWVKFEEKKMVGETKLKGTVPKLPLSDNQIRQEDMKKKSFAQNNGRKYGLTNEDVKNIKNKENSKESKCKNGVNVRNTNTKDAKDSKKKIEPTPSPPVGVKKNSQKKVQNQVEEKVLVKKAIDRKTGKIVEIRKVMNESSVEDKNPRRVPKYTDTGLNKLRKLKERGEIKPILEEPELQPSVEEPDSTKKNKRGTNVKPFSFEVREKEFLRRKETLAKMGEERKYEIKKWARSPEILKKKPFSIHTQKRYILPDLYKLKFKTEERIKKRPKFDAIVEQKQKSLREQQLMKHMAQVKELRKSQVLSPAPIPENILRLLHDAKKAKSDVSSEVSGSNEDLFSNLEYTDVDNHDADAGLTTMLDESECQINSSDDFKNLGATIGKSDKKSNFGIRCENTSNDDSSDGRKAILSVEEHEAEKQADTKNSNSTGVASKQNPSIKDDSLNDDPNESSDASSSAEITAKFTPYNLLLSAFKKKF